MVDRLVIIERSLDLFPENEPRAEDRDLQTNESFIPLPAPLHGDSIDPEAGKNSLPRPILNDDQVLILIIRKPEDRGLFRQPIKLKGLGEIPSGSALRTECISAEPLHMILRLQTPRIGSPNREEIRPLEVVRRKNRPEPDAAALFPYVSDHILQSGIVLGYTE